MRDKRIKLIYFSLKGSEVKDFALGWKKLILFSSMLLVILTLLIGAGFSLFTDIYENTQVMSLQKVNESLITQLSVMRSSIDQIKSQVSSLEGDDDERRMIAGLQAVGEDMRLTGKGGPEPDYPGDFDLFPKEMRDEVIDTRDLIDQLNSKITLLKQSRKIVSETLTKKDDEVRHLPTIYPVSGGRITSSFGWRIDPFTDQRTQHRGIDIAAPKGTPVYATADGIVVKVIKSHNKKSYGKYIVIEHSYGRKTVYAHLNKITVRNGTHVKRWEKIGEVGDTGRAAGDHLHYEVRVADRHENPTQFFFQ
ncbi:M23 family metallopeptidase [candidate division KSB1 bacterium]|nr:M23 family metallopeptidase [candidate division KSB1 bacterium]MBL7094718.1 M23 family metallopeptidase [candidate division KSB1 bacterium]